MRAHKKSAELLVCVHHEDWAKVATLLESRADADASGQRSVSALMLAAEKGSLETCSALLASRANLNKRDKGSKGGNSALMYACRSRATQLNSALDVVQFLLQAGSCANLSNAVGLTPLMLAAGSGASGVVSLLLEAAADVHARANTHGLTLPDHAQKGDSPHPGALLPRKGRSPIQPPAGVSGQVRRTFFEDCTTNVVDSYVKQRRAVDMEEQRRLEEERSEIADMAGDLPLYGDLSAKAGEIWGFDDAEKESEISDVDDFYENLTGTFMSRVAPLRPADQARPPETEEECQLHLKQAAAIRHVGPRQGDVGLTALIAAACKGHSVVCELLLRHGADPNSSDGGGDTAIHAAAFAGHLATCKVLLAGPGPNIGSSEHAAALAAAKMNGHEAVINALTGYEVVRTMSISLSTQHA